VRLENEFWDGLSEITKRKKIRSQRWRV